MEQLKRPTTSAHDCLCPGSGTVAVFFFNYLFLSIATASSPIRESAHLDDFQYLILPVHLLVLLNMLHFLTYFYRVLSFTGLLSSAPGGP